MILVKAKPFKDYFRATEGTRFPSHGIPWSVRYRHWLHPLFFMILAAAIFLVLSIANSFFLAISASIVTYLILIFKQTRRVAYSIDISRSLPKSYLHRKNLKVILTIKNRSRFLLSDLVIKDSFTVSSLPDKTLWLGYEIGARESVKVEYEIPCDAGMGKQYFGPLQVIFSDPLGLFEFSRIDDQRVEIDIVPSPSPKLAEITTQSLFSDSLGNQESPRPGDSVSFYELRNYTAGDSLKRISWKLSARFQKLLVKEFEDLISNDFTMFLDFDEEKHYGVWRLNTWEALKEVGTSILIHKNINRRFQVLSQNLLIPFSSGEQQAALAIRKICQLKPTKGYAPLEFNKRLQTSVPYGSSLIYIGPTTLEHSQEMVDSLRLLRQKGAQIACILIDTSSFTKAEEKGELGPIIAASTIRTSNALGALHSRIRELQIPVTILTHEDFLL